MMPASVTSQWINATGLAILVGVALNVLRLEVNPVAGALLCMGAYALPVILLEVLLLRTHQRASTQLDWSRVRSEAPSWPRLLVKLVGLFGSVALVVVAHWLLRLYPTEDMRLAGKVALAFAPLAVPLSVAYFLVVDRAMLQPEDGYWHAGCLFVGRRRAIDWAVLREHALGWVIKGFFLPIMFVYLVKVLARLQQNAGWLNLDYVMIVRWLADYAVLVELSIVCIGYLCTFRALDAHIRSPNSLFAAWLVTLVCYEPFNRVVSGGVLKYDDGTYWFDWLAELPMLAIPWALALIASFAVWVWSTAAYGIRWSNLTNRGIITNGPYKYTKHPDYVSKSVFFWLIHVPFLSEQGIAGAIQASALLLLVNGIYFGRAKVEERHLSADPTYVAYALEMNRRSVFRGLAALLPMLRYRVR